MCFWTKKAVSWPLESLDSSTVSVTNKLETFKWLSFLNLASLSAIENSHFNSLWNLQLLITMPYEYSFTTVVLWLFSYIFSLRLKVRIPEVWAPNKWGIRNLDLEGSNIHIYGNSDSSCLRYKLFYLDRKTSYWVSSYTDKICYMEKQTRFWICIYVLYAQCI